MSYELVKLQSNEGFSYAPGANKHINFSIAETGVIDMSKSYVILNTTPVVRQAQTLVDAVGADFVQIAYLGVLGSNGKSPYKTSALVRNSRLNSKNTKFYLENRDLNIREANLQLYSKDLSDHQNDSLTGAGLSVLDSETGQISQSVFIDKLGELATLQAGTATSAVKSADLIVPMCDLLGDVGDMQLFPAGLLGDMNLELEIEDRFNVIDVLPSLNEKNVTITYGAGEAKVTDATAILSTINIDSAVLRNSNGLQEAELYVGQVLKLVITVGGGVGAKEADVVITALDYNTADDDAVEAKGGPDFVQVSFNKTIGSIVEHVDGVDDEIDSVSLQSVQVYSGTPSYVINRAELVIARKRLPQKVVEDYYKAVVREGMVYDCYETIAWNRNNTTDVSEFYTLPTMTKAVMNVTPQGKDGESKSLYSLVGGMEAYRWTVNDMDTTNRDVLIADQVTSGLYKHKVKTVMMAMGKTAKAVGNDLTNLMYGQVGVNTYVAYPLEYIPAVNTNITLKLNMKGTGMTTGESFLILKREKMLTF